MGQSNSADTSGENDLTQWPTTIDTSATQQHTITPPSSNRSVSSSSSSATSNASAGGGGGGSGSSGRSRPAAPPAINTSTVPSSSSTSSVPMSLATPTSTVRPTYTARKPSPRVGSKKGGNPTVNPAATPSPSHQSSTGNNSAAPIAAVVISARPINSFLPPADATMAYLDGLLAKAEKTRCAQEKILQGIRKNIMEEAKRSKEEQLKLAEQQASEMQSGMSMSSRSGSENLPGLIPIMSQGGGNNVYDIESAHSSKKMKTSAAQAAASVASAPAIPSSSSDPFQSSDPFDLTQPTVATPNDFLFSPNVNLTTSSFATGFPPTNVTSGSFAGLPPIPFTTTSVPTSNTFDRGFSDAFMFMRDTTNGTTDEDVNGAMSIGGAGGRLFGEEDQFDPDSLFAPNGVNINQDSNNLMMNNDPISMMNEKSPPPLDPIDESSKSPEMSQSTNSSTAMTPVPATSTSDDAITTPIPNPRSALDEIDKQYSQQRRLSTAAMSKKFLYNFLQTDALNALCQAWRENKISIQAWTQFLSGLAVMLEPDDHEHLLKEFRQMNIGKWDTNLHGSAKNDGSKECPCAQPLPVYIDDLCPTEAAPDDPDGVARLRIMMRYNTLHVGEGQVMHIEKERVKHKRKSSMRDDAGGENGGTGEKDNEEMKSDIYNESISSSSTTIAPQDTYSHSAKAKLVYRIGFMNRSFERIFGYRQCDTRAELAAVGQRYIYKFVRSDHVLAFHQILLKWKCDGVNEGHMYQVRLHADGSEIYCLVHIRVAAVQGILLEASQSIIPLPEEEQCCKPPFEEGVDLSPDVLLFGFNKPRCEPPLIDQQGMIVPPYTQLPPMIQTSSDQNMMSKNMLIEGGQGREQSMTLQKCRAVTNG